MERRQGRQTGIVLPRSQVAETRNQKQKTNTHTYMKPILIVAILTAILMLPVLGVIYRAYASPPGELTASNTAGLTDGGIVTRFASTAFTVPNLVAGVGTTAGLSVAPCAATGVVPVGFAPDTAAVGESVAVQAAFGDAVLGVASAAIAADVLVYTAAGGKLSSTGGTGKYLMGRSLKAAGADGDEFPLIPYPPTLQP